MKWSARPLALLLLALLLFACRPSTGSPAVDETPTPSQETTANVYVAPEGWSFRYPAAWERVESGFVQDAETGKTITFESAPSTEGELEAWIASEIERKLAATEADNTLLEPLSVSQQDGLAVYRYAIRSRMEARDTVLRTTVFLDGSRRYAFYAAVAPVTEEEYALVVGSFSTPQ